jgi:hypothetical protein
MPEYMTKLVLHYAPGILVVLKRNDCRGRLAGWSNQPKHGTNCGCHGKHTIWTTVGKPVIVSNEEASWCLEQSFINRELAHRESA